MYFGPLVEAPPVSVTMTSSAPAAVAAVLAVISVSETTLTSLAAMPIVTVEPLRKPLPLIFTAVPPELGPEVGVMLSTLGGAM